MSDTTPRTFEYKDDKSSKFWEMTQSGSTVKVRFGKTGTNGQSQEKVFADEAAASKHVQKLIAEKTGNGYVEQGTNTVTPVEAGSAVDVKEPAASQPVKPEAKPKSIKPAKPKNPAQDPDATPESLMAMLDQDDATNRLLAKHPKASAELLGKLSRSSDQATRRAVCFNPNTSKNVLLRLAPQFPGEFFLNPSFDWLLLEDPDLVFKLDDGVLKNILKRPDCPLSFMQWAVEYGDEQEQLAVAMNPKASEELIAVLATKSETVSEAAKGRLDSASNIDVNIDQVFRNELEKSLAELSYVPWQYEHFVLTYLKELNFACRVRLMGFDPPVIAIGSLPDAAHIFSVDQDHDIRSLVAGHQATPVEILNQLLFDKNSGVRSALARNLACPDSIIEKLLVDTSPEVRVAVARSRMVKPCQLNALALDESSDVRLAVTRSVWVTRDLLDKFLLDQDPLVREEAAVQLKRLKVAHANPETPAGQLMGLAASKFGTVRCAVAANSSTPEAALRLLAKNANADIWKSLAKNPSLPDDLYQLSYRNCIDGASVKLLDYVLDPDCPTGPRCWAAAKLWKLRTSMYCRDDVKDLDEAGLVATFRKDCFDILHQPFESRYVRVCYSSGIDIDIDPKHVDRCSVRRERGLRLLGLLHPKMSLDILAKRSKSTDWVERMAIARNPSVPPNILSTLKSDPNQMVARQAQATEASKSQNKLRQDEILLRRVEHINLEPIVNAVYRRLRLFSRPWQVAGTPWWDILKPSQKIGIASVSGLKKFINPMLSKSTNSLLRKAWNYSNVLADDWRWQGYKVLFRDEPSDRILNEARERNLSLEDALEYLAKDERFSVRLDVSKYIKTPPHLLELLSSDEDYYIRLMVATNPSTPWTLIKKLSNDKSLSVRRVTDYSHQSYRYIVDETRLAKSQKTSPEALVALGSKGYWGIRMTALNNPNYPQSLQENGLKVLWEEIESSLESNLDINNAPPLLLQKIEPSDFIAALDALDLMPEPNDKKAVAAAAKSTDLRSRVAAILTPGIQPSLLRMLLDDDVEAVRQLAAQKLKEMEAA